MQCLPGFVVRAEAALAIAESIDVASFCGSRSGRSAIWKCVIKLKRQAAKGWQLKLLQQAVAQGHFGECVQARNGPIEQFRLVHVLSRRQVRG